MTTAASTRASRNRSPERSRVGLLAISTGGRDGAGSLRTHHQGTGGEHSGHSTLTLPQPVNAAQIVPPLVLTFGPVIQFGITTNFGQLEQVVQEKIYQRMAEVRVAADLSLRKISEILGLAYSAQLQKLKKKPWARVSMIDIHDTAGRKQALACLHLDSMPMWQATFEPSRVASAVRPKLARFQNECAQALRDHFFGQSVERSVEQSVEDPILVLLQNAAQTLQAVTQTRQAQLALEHKIDVVNDTAVQANTTAGQAKEMAKAAMQALDAETGFRTVRGFLKSKGVRMPTKMAAEHGKRLTKLCRERGILFRKAPDEIWDEGNSYPIELLDEYFKDILGDFGPD
jgi:antirepressor protein